MVRKCVHCAGATAEANDDALIRVNLGLVEHGKCLWSDGWEICFWSSALKDGGMPITGPKGEFRGTLFELC